MATNGKLYAGTWLVEAVHTKLNQKADKEGLTSQGDAVRVAICQWLGIPVAEATPPKADKPPKAPKAPKLPKAPKDAATGTDSAKSGPPKAPKKPKPDTETLSDLEDLDDEDEDDEDDDEPQLNVKSVTRVAPKKETPRIDKSPVKVAEKRAAVNPVPVKAAVAQPPVAKVASRPLPGTGDIAPIEKK